MKKHLIAAAVAAAVTVPAAAQVTVSGALEAGYVSNKNADNTTRSGVSGNMWGTPHFRFTGSEDLGGGLKAGFFLNDNMRTDNGENAANFDETFVTLSGGFGAIQLGKFDVVGRDVGGVYRFMGDIGRLASEAMPGGADLVKTNNIQYTTPTIQGVTGMISRSGGARTTAAAIGQESTGVMLRGVFGPTTVAVMSQDFKAANTGVSSKASGLGGNVSLGATKIGLVMVKLTPPTAVSANKSEATSMNVAHSLGGGFTVGGSVAKYKTNNTALKTDISTLGAKYDLSKRTFIAASYQQIKTPAAGGAEGLVPTTATLATQITATRGLGVAARTGGGTNSGYGITIVHSF
jgi:predicted porin